MYSRPRFLLAGLAALAVLCLLAPTPSALASDCISLTSGPWSNFATWDACNDSVPGATDTATILAGHAVTLDADTAVLTVTVEAGGQLDISGRTLSLAGDGTPLTVESAAVFTTTGSTVVYNGATAQSVATANVDYASLTVDNAAGVTLTDAVTIPVTLTLAAGTFDNSGGALTLGDGATIVRSGGELAAAADFAGQVDLLYTGAISVTSGPELSLLPGVVRDLTVTNASTVTLGIIGTRVNGNLVVDPASALVVKNNGFLQVYGNATVGISGTLTASEGMTLSTSLLYFYGPTFTNNGTVTVNTILDADGSQALAGSGAWTGGYLSIGQLNAPYVSLANDVLVDVTLLQLVCLYPCNVHPTLDLQGHMLTLRGIDPLGTLINSGVITGAAPSVVRAQGIMMLTQVDAQDAVFATPLEVTAGLTTASGTFSGTVTAQSFGTLEVVTAMTVAGNLTVGAGGFVSVGGSGVLNLRGNWTNSGGALTGTGEVAFIGPANQTIGGVLPTTFYTLTVNNPAGVALNANATVNSLLNLNAGTLNVGSNKTLTLRGAITSGGGGLINGTNATVKYDQAADGQVVLAANYNKLTFTGFSKVLPDGGTVRIANTFDPGTAITHTVTGSTVEFNGSAAQTAPANFPAYYNLTISNTHTNGVTLGGPTTVYGTLTLATGPFKTSSQPLTVADGAGIVRNRGTLSAAPIFAGQADLTYIGATAVTPGPEMPASPSVLRNLAANNTGGVNLTTDPTVNGGLTIAPACRLTARSGGFLTVKGDFSNSGAFTANNGSVFFAGNAAQNVTANVLTTFYNLTVNGGATLVEVVAADNVTVTKTLTNTGVIRKTQAIVGPGPLSFGLTGVQAVITATGTLDNVQVDRVDADSLTATAGVRTGRHWIFSANESAGGFDVSLTLPHSGLADPTACRWNGDFWDCDRTSFDAASVTREGVTAFSDWAVGNGILPAVSPAVTISLAAPNVVLAWPPHDTANAEGYRVWFSADPYFLPRATGALSATVTAPNTDYTHPGAAGDPAQNFYYVVQGRNAAGAASGPSNRTAVFTFGLTPGTP